MLPAFSMADTAMQSVKAEGLHSKFSSGTQTLNFAKGLEELGVTQMGKTPEEREEHIKEYTKELVRTMIASRGLFDGNALFAMTNNSGGAAANWDMNMATVVAPIIGDVMKHSKLGNADYMISKSYAGGHITSPAVKALEKYHLTDDGDTWTDYKGQEHLNANSKFAQGINENLWNWSSRILQKLRDGGIDTSDQKQMDAVLNDIGPNKSATTMLRALMGPLTRGQIEKEMILRDKVPQGAAGILQDADPVLKVDALHKKLDDFFTALGGPLTDTAISALTKMTTGLNTLSQFMAAHPDVTKIGGDLAAVASGVLVFSGAIKLLGSTLGIAGGAGVAGAAGGAAAGAVGLVPQVLGLLGLIDFANQKNALAAPKREGWKGAVEFLDPGLADRMFGKQETPDTAKPGSDDLASLHHLWEQISPMSKALAAPSGQPSSVDYPPGFSPMSWGGAANGNLIDTLAQGVAKGLQLYAGGGGASGMGGSGNGIVNASWGGGSAGAGGGGGGTSPLLRGQAGGYHGSGGANPYAGGAGGGTFVPPTGDHLTAGMRQNNMGNIGFFGQHMAGLIGPSNAHDVDHSIAKFATQEDGIRAAAALALGKFHKGRHTTWDIIAAAGGWTPGALGPGASVNVARAMGVGNHDQINLDDPAQMVRFLHGLAVQEHGPAGRYYSEERIRSALGHRTVSPPPPRPAEIHVHAPVHLDGKQITASVTKRIVTANRFPTGMGTPDTRSHYVSPGTPLADVA